ncbi:hypothetical protein LTR09_007565 [Extremus antarcticus]|uniref:Uncharacterized protein n=1 Tax=Extremus antarcticus TaxID=702011 RepID=A0AAJ0DJL1_9PEZI|nr:hypothetical protein LTR09_007565 [Extremus antarcticus]
MSSAKRPNQQQPFQSQAVQGQAVQGPATPCRWGRCQGGVYHHNCREAFRRDFYNHQISAGRSVEAANAAAAKEIAERDRETGDLVGQRYNTRVQVGADLGARHSLNSTEANPSGQAKTVASPRKNRDGGFAAPEPSRSAGGSKTRP